MPLYGSPLAEIEAHAARRTKLTRGKKQGLDRKEPEGEQGQYSFRWFTRNVATLAPLADGCTRAACRLRKRGDTR